MRLQIRTRRLADVDELLGHVERRLAFALGRFGERVEDVRVWIDDVNGPRGGRDMRCRIRARLRAGAVVTVEDLDSSAVSAADRSAERLARSVARILDRQREWADHGAGVSA